MYLIIIILAVVFAVYVKRNFKPLSFGSLVLVTGGVKCGKSTLSVHMAIREYKASLRSWRMSQFLYKLTKLERFNHEKPLLYSNVPLKCKYVPLTTDLLLRKNRFAYGSIIYIQEFSLVADAMSYKYIDNDSILEFIKLCGHSTKGGKVIIDTQSVADCHNAVKKSLSQYYYIQKLVKWLPGFLVAYVRECRYSEDGSVVSVDTDDLDLSMKKVLIPKRVWKKFDCYCYSVLTDNLPKVDNVIDCTNVVDLKARMIVSFKEKYNEKN